MVFHSEFRAVDAALLRATSCPPTPELPSWPDLTGQTTVHVKQWRNWLRSAWELDAFVEAVEVASPALAARVRQVCDGQVTDPRRVRRAVESVVRYRLRWTSRATPFGLFAGIAAARLGSAADVQWGERHRIVARPDAAWLMELVASLEANPQVLRRLPVVANNVNHVRGDRLVVAFQQHTGDSGDVALRDVSVRHTNTVALALRLARDPITIGDLTGKLAAEFTEASPTVIERMLTELVARRVLITCLHPPMDVTDPLGHVVKRLTETGTRDEANLPELRAINGLLSRHDQTLSPRDCRTIRQLASSMMAAICDRPAQPLGVDVRLDCSVTLPSVVAREAEAAASALTRLTPYPTGNPAWGAYLAAFLDRYGLGAVVPLHQLVDADTGLGFPAGYRGSLAKHPEPVISARDRKLAELAQGAALDGGSEVRLDDQKLADLAAGLPADAREATAPPHTELRFSLHASSVDALDRGDFTLTVVSAARAAGTTVGRFLHLLSPVDRDRTVRALASLPTSIDGAQHAQVSCPPLLHRMMNVAHAPAVFPSIPISEHRPDANATISLDDLAVSCDAHRLYLMSMSQGRVVEPVMLNAVEFRRATQPLARFLAEITTARSAACVPFSWGNAADLPFLPRIRYRRSVLSPARWNLSAGGLPTTNAAWPEWSQAMAELRRRYKIPDHVHVGEGDIRIRLDLNELCHLAMLRSHLGRKGDAALTEVPGDDAFGWIGGRAHEIVIPLASTGQRLPAPSAHRPTDTHAHTPGCSSYLYAKLFGHPQRHNEILTTHLPGLLSDWDVVRWWFVRYHEPEPHLRLRVHLHHAGDYGDAALRVGDWAGRLHRKGLVRSVALDTYFPETGRYGNGLLMDAAEAVFAVDSAAAIAQLRSDADTTALTVASLTSMSAAFTGGVGCGMQWLTDHLRQVQAPSHTPPRELHDQAMLLADPSGDWATLRSVPDGAAIHEAWTRREAALTAYRDLLDADPSHGFNPDTVLASLAHMHHIRIFGVDRDTERLCLRLARAAALGWLTRATTSRA